MRLFLVVGFPKLSPVSRAQEGKKDRGPCWGKVSKMKLGFVATIVFAVWCRDSPPNLVGHLGGVHSRPAGSISSADTSGYLCGVRMSDLKRRFKAKY